MTDPKKSINDSWTVGDLIEEFEGSDFVPADTSKDHFICDFCSKGVNYKSNPRVGHYIADSVLNTDHPMWQKAQGADHQPLVPLASYCEECSANQLLFPCEDYSEVRMFFDLDERVVMHNVEITDVSPRDDGIPWNPKELAAKVMDVNWDAYSIVAALAGEDDLWGPENMVTFFLSSVDDVDIRDVVKWNGEINPKKLGLARRKYAKFREKMSSGQGASRKKFRDHVRGDE